MSRKRKSYEVVTPPLPSEPIQLNAAQSEQVHEAEKAVVDLKCKLANLMVQQLSVTQEVVNAERALIDKISEFAKQFGIVPEVANQWKFDTQKMTFTKVR
jgi:hypothetical protein